MLELVYEIRNESTMFPFIHKKVTHVFNFNENSLNSFKIFWGFTTALQTNEKMLDNKTKTN